MLQSNDIIQTKKQNLVAVFLFVMEIFTLRL